MQLLRCFVVVVLTLASTSLASPVPPLQPRDVSCSNGPSSRSCWGNSYNTQTDWYQDVPDTGKVVRYNLHISSFIMAPDGVFREMAVFNGQYPGPTIVADWGDTVEITVTNGLTNNGTSIHWHGMRQLNSNQMDGTNGLTECPLPPGRSKIYRFKATQYGTSWYHSHYSIQYVDGLVGTIQINGPTTSDYDMDLGVLPITDWYHTPVQRLLAPPLAGPPVAQNILVNGSGVYQGAGQYHTTTLQQGKKHKLRLVNTGMNAYLHVSLDGHQFTVVAADFIPIKPYVTTSLVLAVGQRYEIIIDANQAVANYWLRVSGGGGQCDGPLEKNDTQAAIFAYAGAPWGNPWSTPWWSNNTGCVEETAIVPEFAVNPIAPTTPPTVLELVMDTVGGISWKVNGRAMLIDWTKPTLSYVINGTYTLPETDNALIITGETSWNYWLIHNTTPLPHPIHLHGHDFVVVGQGMGSGVGAPLSLQNPLRRDTHTVDSGGYLIIGFQADNPGVWLLHCHVPFHVASGLGVQFIERPTEIVASLGDLSGVSNECSAWSKYTSVIPGFKQWDSGLRKE